MSFEKDTTIIIKSFERPECLFRLLDSIRLRYTEIAIVICDDSRESVQDRIDENYSNVTYVKTDFDIGASAGRNVAVKNVKTKYFMLMDDDFCLSDKNNIEACYNKIIANQEYDIVGGSVLDSGWKKRMRYGIFTENEHKVHFNSGKIHGEKNGIIHCDFIINFFIGVTETIVNRNLWDEDMKCAPEHDEFFYRAKLNGLKVGYCQETEIDHLRSTNAFYKQYRALTYYDVFIQKYGKKLG